MQTQIELYIQDWQRKGYSDGIPDEGNLRLEQLHKIPSYRKIALAILRNDYGLQSLGLSKKPSIYYHALKKIEIENRKDFKKSNQISMY